MGWPVKLCGRAFERVHLDFLNAQLVAFPRCCRAELARRFCQHFGWRDLRGQLKLMSARVALLKLHRLGCLKLPCPRNGNGNGPARRPPLPLDPTGGSPACIAEVRDFELALVVNPPSRLRWNQQMATHHYLGCPRMGGAQLRYWVRCADHGEVGALGFGAAAWKVAARDRWIGWDAATRQSRLPWVLNQARFLILPWVRCPNLGSRILARCAEQVPQDFQRQYGYRPVLLETFVSADRFPGTVYRAANWVWVGQTAGRGKWDREGRAGGTRKTIWLYPLVRNFREQLGLTA